MREAGFRPGYDRLFCCGDLIDRGEEHHLLPEFLEQPGVFAVKGNHEDDLLRILSGPHAGDPSRLARMLCDYDQMWFLHELSHEAQSRCAALLAALPLAIEIQTPAGLVGIVHAEPLPTLPWSLFTELLEAGEPMAADSAIWGREIAEGREEPLFDDIWRVFSGHTPSCCGIQKSKNHYRIDTGAVFGLRNHAPGGCITIAQIDAPDSILLASPKRTGLINAKFIPAEPAPLRSQEYCPKHSL